MLMFGTFPGKMDATFCVPLTTSLIVCWTMLDDVAQLEQNIFAAEHAIVRFLRGAYVAFKIVTSVWPLSKS